jgi:hypothetical protein
VQQLFHFFLAVEGAERPSGRLFDVVDSLHEVGAARSTDLRREQDMLIEALLSGRKYWHTGLWQLTF